MCVYEQEPKSFLMVFMLFRGWGFGLWESLLSTHYPFFLWTRGQSG